MEKRFRGSKKVFGCQGISLRLIPFKLVASLQDIKAKTSLLRI